MTFKDQDVQIVANLRNVEKQRAKQALEVVDGDLRQAMTLIEEARGCGQLEDDVFKPFDPFGKFIENAEFLAENGDVRIVEAAEVLQENDGGMMGAQDQLNAYMDETPSPDPDVESSSSVSDDRSEQAGDEKSFTERVKEIRERRETERREQQGRDVDGRSPSGSKTPSSGSSSADPGSKYPPGTFVVPRNKHFLQKLEARARDGQANLVETAYALTGETYTHPTDLIPLDNREFYLISTRTQTGLNVGAMANEVARSYSGASSPNVIAKFHTHPGGIPKPSPADQSNARQIYQAFVNSFATDDFEFFHGIHSLREHGRSPRPAERQQPSVDRGRLVWDDEQFRHSISVYGPDFQTQKSIIIESDGT